ncbi:related to Vacuolar amino acid transporter 6 [Saccharomycodes ludwigii]|uniref:Related to Vacuolar amino acid transporter 6 n=1 Tax=Saccharomycodes ludwigii TaxID=36035 RepID=A0A376B1I2_9ASCO|nr:hypothetical protein SCDLUD_000145 [Saccharomycodes ludwigii]KAH3902565.1 hypothetical protein SCDLUD_000145 [Saccharomycodes ludwigii]SSD58535.1 related to Vacuolar amino acid transporter 6 [Saccharomycodes ludwigii]
MPTATAKSGAITLLHTACGAGILAMPFAFKTNGLILGTVSIIFSCMCATFGLMCQAKASKYSPHPNAISFFQLAQLTYPSLGVVFDIAIAIKCFGVSVSYLIVVGDLLPQIVNDIFQIDSLSDSLLLNRKLHITLVMFFIVGPLCFIKKLDSLKHASTIAISSVAYLALLVIFHFIWPSQEIKDLRGTVDWLKPKPDTVDGSFLSSFTIFVFAYTCHHNTFSVISDLNNKTVPNIQKMILIAMCSALLIYTIIGTMGYATFGNNIRGNIITMYPSSISTTIGRIGILFLVMFAYPLQCHPCRASIHNILTHYSCKTDNTINDENSPLTENAGVSQIENDIHLEENSPLVHVSTPDLADKQFILITITILICSYLLAITVRSLATMLSVVGATGSTSISFILPGIFAYKLIGSEYQQNHNSPGYSGAIPTSLKIFKKLALCLSIWGVIVMVTSLYSTFFL